MHILDRVLRIFEGASTGDEPWQRYPLRIDKRDDSFPVEVEGEKCSRLE
jgi:hypothetical protein